MKIFTSSVANAIPLQFISERSTLGIGLLTMFISGFCNIFGIPNGLYSKKMQKAEENAMKELSKIAASIGADGIMDVRCEICNLSVLVYGTAYKMPIKFDAQTDIA